MGIVFGQRKIAGWNCFDKLPLRSGDLEGLGFELALLVFGLNVRISHDASADAVIPSPFSIQAVRIATLQRVSSGVKYPMAPL